MVFCHFMWKCLSPSLSLLWWYWYRSNLFFISKETVNKYTAQSNDALLWEKVLDLDVPTGFKDCILFLSYVDSTWALSELSTDSFKSEMVKKKSFLIAVYRTSGIRVRSSRRSSFYLQSSVYFLAGQRSIIQSTSAFHWGIIMSWPAIVGYYSRQPTHREFRPFGDHAMYSHLHTNRSPEQLNIQFSRQWSAQSHRHMQKQCENSQRNTAPRWISRRKKFRSDPCLICKSFNSVITLQLAQAVQMFRTSSVLYENGLG